MVNIFLKDNTYASLCLNEKCDPAVQTDLESAMDAIFACSERLHDTVDDGSYGDSKWCKVAAAKTVAMGQSLDIPVVNGQLGLGSYQASS